jgi:LmbE family N-acetylglucosaminyl deacetylase
MPVSVRANARLSILAIFAHPDDEVLAAGGTLARYAAEGVQVRLLCATRGEAGSPGEPECCPREVLGSWRERELGRSCRALGIGAPLFLHGRDGYLEQDEVFLTHEMVAAIRQLKPTIVVALGSEGMTGHPDHVAVHRAATAAVGAAGNPRALPELMVWGLAPHTPARLYYSVLPSSLVDSLDCRLPGELDGRPLQLTGVPDERVAAAVDIRPFAERKLRALACHRTQRHDLFRLSAEDLARLSHREYFVRASDAHPGRPDEDLFAGLRAPARAGWAALPMVATLPDSPTSPALQG